MPDLNDVWLPVENDDGTITPQMDGVRTWVTRRRGDGVGEDSYDVLDNVTWTQIRAELGDNPGSAKLRYLFGTDDPADPQHVEEALSSAFTSPKVIEPGDRITIFAETRYDAVIVPIFDGIALGFGGGLGPKSEAASVTCLGIGFRLRDTPIAGATYRDAHQHDNPLYDVETEAEVHFNPRGVGNRTKANIDAWSPDGETDPDRKYPPFLDPAARFGDPGDTEPNATTWSYADAARYLLWKHNRGEEFVKNPPGLEINELLAAKVPREGITFDPRDPETFDYEALVAPDKPVGGKDLVGAIRELIRGKGFEVCFRTEGTEAGEVTTRLEVFKPQDREAKPVRLQARGQALDLARSNLAAMSAMRDLTSVYNEVLVEGEHVEVEATYILACGFPKDAISGLTTEELAKLKKSSPDFPAYSDAFRLFILDEAGEGHYLPGSSTKSTTPPELVKVFGSPEVRDGKSYPTYVARRRPPLAALVSTDALGADRKPRLSYSTDYAGASPLVWDRTDVGDPAPTWHPIAGGFEVLKDRVGIRVTAEDPNGWKVGDGKVLKVVQSLYAPDTANPTFHLRLTVAVRSDKRCQGLAARKTNNVLTYPIRRVVDARDRYKLRTINEFSELSVGAETTRRDDRPAALAEAQAMQAVAQHGILDAPLTIPWFTRFYLPGDRISEVQGRDLSFRTDRDGDEGDPILPVVTAVTWHNGDRAQATVLECSDADAARPSMRGLARPAAAGSRPRPAATRGTR